MANNVAGLRGFVEDRPSLERTSRSLTIPTKDAPTPTLRPSSHGVADTYTGPARVPVLTQGMPGQRYDPSGDQMNRLVQSLSSLAPSLEKFFVQREAEQNKNIDGQVVKRLAGKSAEEQAALITSDPLFKNKVAKEYGDKLFGLKKADETVERLKQGYMDGTFDREGGDLQKYINEAIQKDLDGIDPAGAKEYADRIRAGTNVLYSEQTKFQTERKLRSQDDTIYGAFRATVNQGIDEKKSGAEVLASIDGQMKANKALTNKPFSEQEGLILQSIQQMAGEIRPDDPQAEQKFRVIEEMLNAKRKLPDGTEMSFLERGSTQGTAAKILHAARAAQEKAGDWTYKDTIASLRTDAASGAAGFKQKLDAFVKEHPGVLTAEQYQSQLTAHQHATAKNMAALEEQQRIQAEEAQKKDILQSAKTSAAAGMLYNQKDDTYVDRNGNVKVYPADKIREDAAAAMQQDIDTEYEKAKASGVPEDVAINAKVSKEVQLYGTGMVKNPKWEQLFKNGIAAVDTVTAAGGQIPKAAQEAFQNYRTLRAKAPQLLQAHTDDRNMNFFEAAVVARELGLADTDKDALSLAANATRRPASKINDSLPGAQKFNEKIKAQWGGGWFSTGIADTINADDAVTEARDLATTLAAGLGINWEIAATKAAETVKNRYTIVNGTAVRTADQQVPPNFGELANKYVKYWGETNKAALDKEGVDMRDISIRAVPGSPNTWFLFNKQTLETYDLPGSNFTPRQIEGVLQLQQQKQKVKGDRAVEAEKQRKATSDERVRKGQQTSPYKPLGDLELGGNSNR